MPNVILLLKAIAVLVAAVIVGNWFLAEVRKTKAAGDPLCKAYFTLPGLLILVLLMTPVLLWFIK